MLILRDVGFGALMWLTTLLLMGGNFAAWFYFLGPPAPERERSFAFIAGGAATLVSVVVLGILIGTVIYQIAHART